MRATPEKKEQFSNMVRDFAEKHSIRFQIRESSDRPDITHVRFAKGYVDANCVVNWPEVRSLTEAATAMFVYAIRKLNLDGEEPVAKTPEITNVIFNYPATIVFWSDGTKTVVKCDRREPFDPEKGLAMAISKKMLGNKGNYFNEIKKWVDKFDNPTCFYTFHGVYRDNVDVTGLLLKIAKRIAVTLHPRGLA